MSPITTDVNIPENHQLHLDVSILNDIPSGQAEIMLMVIPRSASSSRTVLSQSFGLLKDSSIAKEDPVALQKAFRDEW